MWHRIVQYSIAELFFIFLVACRDYGGIAEYAGICFIINLHSMGSYVQSERGVVLHRRPHHSLLLFSDWGVARYVLLHVAYHAVSH